MYTKIAPSWDIDAQASQEIPARMQDTSAGVSRRSQMLGP